MIKARILIVDDEKELCMTMRMILNEQWDNYQVVISNSGEEALEILKDKDFDVLVTDIRMSGIDGIELMRQAKEFQKDLQTIIITGHGDFDNAIEALRLGANNFLTKPVYSEVFHFAVKNAWEKKKGIEEHRMAVEALKESERRYRNLFDNAGDVIFVQDFENSFTDVNRVACEGLGYTCEELLNMKAEDIIAPGYAGILASKMESLRKHGHVVFEAEYIKADGSIFPIEANSRIIEYAGKYAIFTIARDISERKKAEQEQAELHSQIRQVQKMESVGTLAGGIAHDFNNILFPIIGYTEMSMDEIPKDHPVTAYLEEILKASNRAKELVTQILTFSRQREHKRIPMKIQYIIKEALKLIRASLPSTINISHYIYNCGTILADAGQMHQVIMNLCTNAYHAMAEKGGTLEVRLMESELSPDEAAAYPDLIPGQYIKMIVSDTGHGMSPEIMGRIFDPYFTTKEKNKGTGLGLSVVHGIIKNHHGHISVCSKPGKGSTFSIYLPLIEASTEVNDIIEDTSIPTGSERILLIDDETQVVEMLKQMLEGLGYNVTSRTSSLEAFEAFRAKPDKFDLVITDATMPNMTGIELSRKILDIRKEIPIILCTGFSEIITKEKAQESGIREYVMKPVLKKDIAETIRRVLD